MSIEEGEQKKRVLPRHCGEAGRDPGSLALSHNATVIISRDAGEVDARAQRVAQAGGLGAAEARERLAHALAGTPDACVSRMRDYVAAGVSWFFLLFPDLPDLSSLRLFAREVLPAVAAP